MIISKYVSYNLRKYTWKKVLSTVGYVKGSSARARHAVADVFASLKNIVGGEVEEYSRLLQQTRDQAVERMIADAEKRELMR